MAEAEKSMFDRAVDRKLEDTHNSYAACRGLSQRARHVNTHEQEMYSGVEVRESEPNPTVIALSDYSRGRIVLSGEADELNQ